MIDLIAMPELRPFMIAGGLVIAFLLIEVVSAAFGVGSILGESEGPEIGADGFDADLDVDFDAEISASDLVAEADTDLQADTAGIHSSGGFPDFLGLRKLPMLIWLAVLLSCFTSTGIVVQGLIETVTGKMLGPGHAALAALLPAGFLSGKVSAWLSRILPGDNSTAISERSYGRRKGVVTVGISSRGRPAQVRFTDRHGNLHYLMCEPMIDSDIIPEKSEVLIIRDPRRGLRIVRTDA